MPPPCVAHVATNSTVRRWNRQPRRGAPEYPGTPPRRAGAPEALPQRNAAARKDRTVDDAHDGIRAA